MWYVTSGSQSVTFPTCNNIILDDFISQQTNLMISHVTACVYVNVASQLYLAADHAWCSSCQSYYTIKYSKPPQRKV